MRAVRGGIAEDYLDASWTTNHTTAITAANPRPQTVHIQSDSNDVRVVSSYEADRKYCSRGARFAGLLFRWLDGSPRS